MEKTDKFWKKFEALAHKVEGAIRKDAQVLANDVMDSFTKKGESYLREIGTTMIGDLEIDFRKRLAEHIDSRFDVFQKKFEELLDKL